MSDIEVQFDPEGVDDGESYPDTLHGPDALIHCGVDAQVMLGYWCGQLGQEVEGSAMSMTEEAGLYVLELSSGKWLSPEQIMAKRNKFQAVK